MNGIGTEEIGQHTEIERQGDTGTGQRHDAQDEADRGRARHRVIGAFLVRVGVPEDFAELDAEGIEHHVSQITLSAFENFIKACGD